MAPPRSVADATRFTATGPHAFTRAPPSSGSASGGETPQQRVARLREAANRAKMDQVGTFDRIVDRGRIWADRAHKVVAIGLIGATVLCGGITIFAFTDMVMFARRKKRAYAEEQRHLQETQKESQILAAVASGTDEATARHEVDLAHEVRKGKPVTTRLKEWALSGLTPPEKEAVAVDGREIAAATAAAGGPVVTAVGTPVGAASQRVGGGGVPRDEMLDRPGADDLVKGGKAQGGSTGMLSSITGWWK
ncbi:uncharacterized protein H6S33_000093 [Morchella sextelata]|uniref:uncharacterized protein n=1 Tax=Morchella sextelata TaxID=1174677 RepID=UPI001D045294|nr:uncharacterized protein H6S33_000093 [Morchella sextelata]KAH0614457.1 hypothetical protein H6S33_000093 [Morchella sextelata]